MRKKTFAPPTPRSKRALALALSAALLAAGTAGAVTLSGYDLYVKDDTAKGGAALRSDSAITKTDIDGLTSNVVHTDKAPYEAKGGAIYSDASVSLTRSGKTLTVKSNQAQGKGSWRDARGGAIFAGGSVTLDAGSVTLQENKATTDSDYLVEAFGGAIYSSGGVNVTADGALTVKGNGTDGKETGGGAIYARNDISLTGSSVTVQSNFTDGESNSNGASSYGGALNSGSGAAKLTATGEVLVTGNSVRKMTSWASGGAISAYKGITLEGGSVTVSSNNVMTISTGEHKENNLAHGGALNSSAGDVTVTAEGAVSLSNNALADIGGSAAGGAVYTEKNVSLSGSTVTVRNNKADASMGTWSHGGAVYAGGVKISSTGALEVSDNSVYGDSKTAYGGAVYSSEAADLTAISSLVVAGTPETGLTATPVGGSVTVRGNTAESSGSSASGGALYTGAELTVSTGGEFQIAENKAVGKSGASGGALYSTKGITLSGAGMTVKDNTAESSGGSATGGALRSSGAAKLTALSGTLEMSGNKATGSSNAMGAAVYAADGVELKGGAVEVTGNAAMGTNSYARGGALTASNGTASVSGTKIMISGNTAESKSNSTSGGAVWAYKGIDVSGGAIEASDNAAKSTSSYAYGGALYANMADAKLSAAGGTIRFTNNAASGKTETYGGAVVSGKGIGMTGDEIGLTGNSAVSSGGAASGGALRAGDGDVTLTADSALSLTDNLADGETADGGAVTAAKALKLTGGAITAANNAVKASGANATARGGALYASSGAASVSGKTAEFTGNTAVSDKNAASGGAIYAEKENVEITASSALTLKGNKAAAAGAAEGGAVWAYKDIALSGGTIEAAGNEATGESVSGGALYSFRNDAKLTASGAVSMTNNAAKGASGAQGGAIYAHAVELSGATANLSGNSAEATSGTASGGAVSAADAVTISTTGQATLSGNSVTASGEAQGGAVHAAGLKLTGKAIASNNSAESTGADASGGFVYFPGAATLAFGSEALVSNNAVKAANDAWGGAVYAGGDLTVTGGTISLTGNKADGSGTYARGGALYSGGAVNISAGNVTFKDNKVTSTKAAWGGAIFAQDSVTVTATRAKFLSAGDTVMTDSGPITVKGSLEAVAGVSFTAGDGDITVSGGQLKAHDVAHSDSVGTADLAQFYAYSKKADFGGSKVALQNVYDESAGTYERDFAYVVADTIVDPDPSDYRHGKINRYELASGTKLAIEFGIARLTWENGDGAWDINDGQYLWTLDPGSEKDDFFQNDHVTFAPTGGTKAEIQLKQNIVASSMTVKDSYAFSGKDLTVTGPLEFAAGDSELGMDTTADQAKLTAGSLRLSAPLTVKTAFTQASGAKLTVAASETFAILNGFGTAALDAAGAALNVFGIGALADGETRTFKVAEAFASLKPWTKLEHDATGLRVEYLPDTDNATYYNLTFTALGNIPLIWNGANGEAWAENDGQKRWLRASDGITPDDFFSGDSVTFNDTSSGTVKLTGALEAEEMTVKGKYAFAGSGTLDVKTLNFENGASTIDAAVTADKATLEDGTLTLNTPLTVRNLFRQTGGQLILTAAAAETSALLSGSGTAVLNAPAGTLFVKGVGALAGGESRTYKVASDFASLVPWLDSALTGDATGLRVIYKGVPGPTAFDVKVTALGNISLIWNGGTNTWKENDGNLLWLRESDGTTPDDFFNGDSAIFPANGGTQTVTLSGTLKADAMTVKGSYLFDGSGSLSVGTLNVTAGQSAFAREITAGKGLLSGSGTVLTMSAPLTVTGSFEQQSGTTLIFDVDAFAGTAPLRGNGTATLTVTSGAKLYLQNAKASYDGVQYPVALDFKTVAGAWKNADVSGTAAGPDISYSVKTSGGSVIVTVIREIPVVPIPFILTAGQSLRNASGVGAQLQGRGAGLTNAPASPMSAALGFLPMEQDRRGGVWASAWYTHARVDNDTADMKFKNYGVTIGADKRFGAGVAGLAVNLGKTEGRGKGEFSGSDSDGKHIGLSLYGARNIAKGAVTLAGDIGYNWHKDDYDSSDGADVYSARKAKSRVFTVGGTAWWNLRSAGKVSVKPFLGLRWSRFSMDDFTAQKNGADWSVIAGESVSQWTVPIGVKFDWTPVTTKKGWKVRPTAELAYVYAGGDRAIGLREVKLSDGSPSRSTQMLTDRNNFRASLGLDAKRNNLTVGVGVNALLSSGQKDVAVNATLRWDL